MVKPSIPDSTTPTATRTVRRLAIESLEDRLTMSVSPVLSTMPLFGNSLKGGSMRSYGIRPVVSITTTPETQTPSKEISNTKTTTPAIVSVPTNSLTPTERRRPNSKFSKPKPVPLTLLPQPTTLQAGPYQNPNMPLPVKQFTVADLTPGGTGGGFVVGSVIVEQIGSTTDTTLSMQLMSVTTQDANTMLTTWQTPNGEATLNAVLTTQGDDRLMQVTLTAGANWTIKQIEIGGPRIYAPSSNDLTIYNAFKGGGTQPWLQDGWHAQSTAAWPNMAYSPLAVFYNAKTTEGVGFVAFDGSLEQRQIFWITSPTEADPYVRWFPNIQPGQSQSTTLQEHHAFNMPTESFLYYRNNFLVPFMQSQGIAEGSLNIGKVMAWTDLPINMDVSASAALALSQGASGYLQYAPGDGVGYYEPNPETLPWFNTLKSASTLQGLDQLGVLIDPFMESRTTSPTTDPTSPLWYPSGGGPESLTDPNVQNFLTRLRTDLVSQGVNFAFWDTGTAPRPGEAQQWFDILKDWKQAGISIAAENSCDIASYVTGTNMFYMYQDNNDYLLTQVVTPKAKIMMQDYRETATDGVYWWQAATAKGFVPLLYRTQMLTWAQQNAL